MGATQSNESAAAALGTSQAGHKQYKSAVTPPLKHPHNESGEAQCPLPTDFPGKIKLSGLAAVDTTTCSTTTCNSSLSGVSTSPETRSTGLGGSANAAALTHFSGTPFERSDSAQAVSSLADQTPRAFHATPDLSEAGERRKGSATKASRWSRRTPQVQGLLKTLGLVGHRSRSQPPASSSSHEDPGNTVLAINESTSFAAALHAHILREEEEHRRRRHSSLLESYTEIGASKMQHPSRPPQDLFEDGNICVSSAATKGKPTASCRASPRGGEASLSFHCGAEGDAAHEMHVSPKGTMRKIGGRRDLQPAQKESRWIADAPANGRWELERGTWNRQGVHLNHMHVADERFRAVIATRQLSPRQHTAQTQAWHGPVVKHLQCPTAQPRRVPIAPLAGHLQATQQRLLQSGHQVVPVTYRGVAAATTIELARSRHANEEKRRQQHCLIASPEPDESTPAAVSTNRKHCVANDSANKLTTGGEETRHGISVERGSALTRSSLSSGFQGAVLKDPSVPAHCFCQSFLPNERHSGACIPNTTDNPTLPEAGSCGEARTSRLLGPTPALPLTTCEQHRELEDRNALQCLNSTAPKFSEKSDSIRCPPATAAFPSASRSLQKHAFVANPRTQVGAPKRRPR